MSRWNVHFYFQHNLYCNYVRVDFFLGSPITGNYTIWQYQSCPQTCATSLYYTLSCEKIHWSTVPWHETCSRQLHLCRSPVWRCGSHTHSCADIHQEYHDHWTRSRLDEWSQDAEWWNPRTCQDPAKFKNKIIVICHVKNNVLANYKTQGVYCKFVFQLLTCNMSNELG